MPEWMDNSFFALVGLIIFVGLLIYVGLPRIIGGMLDKQDRLRRSLPEWAFAPLQLVGMSADEIRGLMTDLSKAETEAGLDQIERDLEQIDSQVEELENILLATPARSLDSVLGVRMPRNQLGRTRVM